MNSIESPSQLQWAPAHSASRHRRAPMRSAASIQGCRDGLTDFPDLRTREFRSGRPARARDAVEALVDVQDRAVHAGVLRFASRTLETERNLKAIESFAYPAN